MMLRNLFTHAWISIDCTFSAFTLKTIFGFADLSRSYSQKQCSSSVRLAYLTLKIYIRELGTALILSDVNFSARALDNAHNNCLWKAWM